MEGDQPEEDEMRPDIPGLLIYRIYNGYWYWGRPSVEELRRDLREVTRKIRPDWDITSPDRRQAWDRGEKERFYPYQRPRERRTA